MTEPVQVANPDDDGYKNLIRIVGGNNLFLTYDKAQKRGFPQYLLDDPTINDNGRSDAGFILAMLLAVTCEHLEKSGGAIISVDTKRDSELLKVIPMMEEKGLVVYNRKTQQIALTRKAVEVVTRHLAGPEWSHIESVPTLGEEAFVTPKVAFDQGPIIGASLGSPEIGVGRGLKRYVVPSPRNGGIVASLFAQDSLDRALSGMGMAAGGEAAKSFSITPLSSAALSEAWAKVGGIPFSQRETKPADSHSDQVEDDKATRGSNEK